MNEPRSSQPAQQEQDLYASEAQGPGLVDALAFLYRKRLKFLLRFGLFLGIGIVIFLIT